MAPHVWASCPAGREYKWRAYFAREARCMGNKCRTQYRPWRKKELHTIQQYLVSIWEINTSKCSVLKLLSVRGKIL